MSFSDTPPVTLPANLAPSNAFRSFVYHFSEYINRTAFSEADFPFAIGEFVTEDTRSETARAKADIRLFVFEGAGGRGKMPNVFGVALYIKASTDKHMSVSMSLTDEIRRVFHCYIPFYDFSSDTPQRILDTQRGVDASLVPVYAGHTVQEPTPDQPSYRIVIMRFNVMTPMWNSIGEVANA